MSASKHDTPFPIIPAGLWNKPVDRGPIAIVPYLPYVFGQVMIMGRGKVNYDWQNDHFQLYMKVEPTDVERCGSLCDNSEVWLVLKGKWRVGEARSGGN